MAVSARFPSSLTALLNRLLTASLTVNVFFSLSIKKLEFLSDINPSSTILSLLMEAIRFLKHDFEEWLGEKIYLGVNVNFCN